MGSKPPYKPDLGHPIIKLINISKLLRQAAARFQQADLVAADQLLQTVLDHEPDNASANHLAGLVALQKGQHGQADRLITRSLECDPQNPDYLDNYGLALLEMGRLDEAKVACGQANQIRPGYAPTYNNLGVIMSRMECFEEAAAFFKQAIQISPDYSEAYNNLGQALQGPGKAAEAIHYYQKALAINPAYIEASYNLGLVFQDQGEHEKAMGAYQRVLSLNPAFAQAYYSLGTLFRERRNHEQAIACFQKALSLNPQYPEAIINIGLVFKGQGRYEDALSAFRKALSIKPDYAEAHCSIGMVLHELGEYDEAIAAYRRALELQPALIVAKWRSLLTLPVHYDSSEDIFLSREHWTQGVQKLLDTVELDTPEAIAKANIAAESGTNFFLPYQGLNDLDAQVLYGKLLTKIAGKAYPGHQKMMNPRILGKNDKIRVGFVSSFFYHHSVYKSHGHWITRLDKLAFDVSVFSLSQKKDWATAEISDRADMFYEPGNTVELIQAIEERELDVLIYTDLGMEPKLQLVSALRLAPVQCNTWGHPVTSGLPTIDYYLGSDAMEPEDGSSHYSEELVRLPNLATSYPYPAVENAEVPSSVEMNSDKVTFLNLQSLFKLMPQHDEVYPRIAKEVPAARFWFLSGSTAALSGCFMGRLRKAFASYGMDADAYCYFHPLMPQNEFLGLAKSADIILDAISWSGCNSSLEALALDKPIVTLPGHMFRARHTYAILKQINVTETIARNMDDYVRIAVELGLNKEFREKISERIASNKQAAYNDPEVIAALEDFLRASVVRA